MWQKNLGRCWKLAKCVKFSFCQRNVMTASEAELKQHASSVHPKMQAWQIHSYGGLEELQFSKSVRPPVLRSPNDVLVKIKSASVNPIDVRMACGYGSTVLNTWRRFDDCSSSGVEFPLILGRDFVGEITEKGHGTKRDIKIGDVVWGVISPPYQGSHAEYAVTKDSNVCAKPSRLTDVEAAALPYAALTAWSALAITAELKLWGARGRRVLVRGASGGVGTCAVQLLRAWDAQVVATSSADAVPLVESLGADAVIDYNDPQYWNMLQKEGPYDVILDASGDRNARDYVNLLQEWKGAKFVTLTSPLLANVDNYGICRGTAKNLADILLPNVSAVVHGRTVRWAFFIPSQTGLQEITDLVNKGKINPIVQQVYPFSDLCEAYKKVQEGHIRGKVVIDMQGL